MFKKKSLEIESEDDARKKKIDNSMAWDLMKSFNSVIIGKGKKYVSYEPDTSAKDEILKAAMGRSGNLRAPAVEIDGKLIIGFNEAMYDEFL